jgi:crossover junction endodeoxyribonuclease RuvC
MIKPSPTIRILGVDPGLNVTGYGLIESNGAGLQVIEAGVIRTPARQSLEQRLLSLHRDLDDVVVSLKPGCVSLEEIYSHQERVQTAIIMGHARGVICLAAAGHQLPVQHYAATQVKKSLTGNGRAPKAQVQLAVAKHLGLDRIPDPPDVADALAIAMCHYYLMVRKSELENAIKMP